MKPNDYERLVREMRKTALLKIYYKGEEWVVSGIEVKDSRIRAKAGVTLDLVRRDNVGLKEADWWVLHKDLSWHPTNSIDFIIED